MVLDFVKGFLTLFLLIKVLLHFVHQKAFEKYIAFFSGVVLVIGLIIPFFQMLGQKEFIFEKSEYGYWEAQLRELTEESGKLKEESEKVLEEYYHKLSEENSQIEDIVIETIKIESGIQAEGADE